MPFDEQTEAFVPLCDDDSKNKQINVTLTNIILIYKNKNISLFFLYYVICLFKKNPQSTG